MSDKLWSPAMRKWARDAHRHGIDIGLAKTRPSRKDMGWGGGNYLPQFIYVSETDDSVVYVANSSNFEYYVWQLDDGVDRTTITGFQPGAFQTTGFQTGG